mmetsp:Transcript_8728/g.25757  ORF Transcript_8728/g.25757 Transcript_8728/m.25757 type:complete len:368 (-) Transcript_8728:192-1295(-)
MMIRAGSCCANKPRGDDMALGRRLQDKSWHTDRYLLKSGIDVPMEPSKQAKPAELGALMPPTPACIEDSLLTNMPRMDTLDKAMTSIANLRTGDMLLYQNADVGSVFNMAAMQSAFSHVGVVIDLDPDEARELYPPDYAHHSPPEDPRIARLSIFEAVENRGVCLFPLEARLARCLKYNRYVAVRKHVGAIEGGQELSSAGRKAALDFIQEVRGRKLAVVTTAPHLFLGILRLYCPCVPLTAAPENRDQYSCGELVAEALQHLQILQGSERITSTSVVPTFFSSRDGVVGQMRLDDFLLPGHRFEEECLLVFPGGPYTAFLVQRKIQLAKERKQRSQTSLIPTADERKTGARVMERRATGRELIELF